MNMDGWCRNMEKYGNPGCHRLSLTESALGAQSSRGGCILICCIMTTGIDNILISLAEVTVSLSAALKHRYKESGNDKSLCRG